MSAGSKGNEKLTSAQVRQIVRRAAGGERTVDLAREFGVVARTIANIRKGRSWRRLKITEGGTWAS